MKNLKKKLGRIEYLTPLFLSLPIAILFLSIKPFEYISISIFAISVGTILSLFRRNYYISKEEDKNLFKNPSPAAIGHIDAGIIGFIILAILALKDGDNFAYFFSAVTIISLLALRYLNHNKYFEFFLFIGAAILLTLTLITLK